MPDGLGAAFDDSHSAAAAMPPRRWRLDAWLGPARIKRVSPDQIPKITFGGRANEEISHRVRPCGERVGELATRTKPPFGRRHTLRSAAVLRRSKESEEESNPLEGPCPIACGSVEHVAPEGASVPHPGSLARLSFANSHCPSRRKSWSPPLAPRRKTLSYQSFYRPRRGLHYPKLTWPPTVRCCGAVLRWRFP